MSRRSLYFKHQPLHDVTGVEVRWFVACASVEAARALLTRATAVTMVGFRDALVECSRTAPSRQLLNIADADAHRWKVAEIVQIAAPRLFEEAPYGIAGTFWTCDLDKGEAFARPRVLAAAVAMALGVATDAVTCGYLDASDPEHVAELGRAPLIGDVLRDIPATGDSDALAAVRAVLDAHFAPPPSSSDEDEEDGDAAAAPPLLPLNGQRVFLAGRSHSGVRGRRADFVRSQGGVVVGKGDNPTLAILENDHKAPPQTQLRHLLSPCRIVRERWLDGVLAAVQLPDFKPDAVYARVRDVRDPRSYFYGAVPDADLVGERADNWKVIPWDWTPAAEADDGS